jgi:hypothetical protein
MRVSLPISALLVWGMGLACGTPEPPAQVLAPYREPPAPPQEAPPSVWLTWLEESSRQCQWMLGALPGQSPRVLGALGGACPTQWSVVASGPRSALYGPGWAYLWVDQQLYVLPADVPFDRLAFDETSLLACGSDQHWRWTEGWQPAVGPCPEGNAGHAKGSGVPSSGWKATEPADQAMLEALAKGAWIVSEDGQFAARGTPTAPEPPLAWRLKDGWQLVYGFEIFRSHNSFAFQDGWLLLRTSEQITLQRAGQAPVFSLPSAQGAAFWPADQPTPP